MWNLPEYSISHTDSRYLQNTFEFSQESGSVDRLWKIGFKSGQNSFFAKLGGVICCHRNAWHLCGSRISEHFRKNLPAVFVGQCQINNGTVISLARVEQELFCFRRIRGNVD